MQKRNAVAVIIVMIGLLFGVLLPIIFNLIGMGDMKVIGDLSVDTLSYSFAFLVVLIGIGLLRDYK